MSLATIAQQLEGAHRDKDGWRAKCPIHGGKSDTSLRLWEWNGEIKAECFGPCSWQEVREHLNLNAQVPKGKQIPELVYSYHDPNGNLAYQVIRYPGKKFQQRRPNPSKPGEYIYDMKGVEKVLYRLPEVLSAKSAKIPIYIVEGEKDVETLRANGLVATTNVQGACKWEDSYSEALKQAVVILIPDNDVAGRKHAQMVETRLRGFVKTLTRLELPDLPESGDVTDWLQDHNISELEDLIEPTKPVIESPHLVFRWLSSVQRSEINWLWEPYIPRGKLSFIEGDPGNGKTFLALQIAASFSKGYALPDQDGRVSDQHSEPSVSLYITAEDDPEDTLRPRAEDMDADLSKIAVIDGWTTGGETESFNFQHTNLLEEMIFDLDAKLVIIDPIDAFLGPDVDMYRPNEVRPIMTQLKRAAAKTECAIVFIRHWTKAPGNNARYRGIGSIAFGAAVRSVMVVGEALDDDRLRIMAHAKSNLGMQGKSQVFGMGDGIFGWYGISEIDADTLSQGQPKKRQHQRKAAYDWLRDLLKGGPVYTQTIRDTAEAMGISWPTVERSKSMLGIIADRDGGRGAWYWTLPKTLNDDAPF